MPGCHSRWASVHRDDRTGLCPECRERLAQRTLAVERRWAACGVPARHARFRRWTELDGPPKYVAALRRVRGFLETGDSVLLLPGDRGLGKSQALCTGVLAAVAAGRTAAYVTRAALLADLQDRRRRRSGMKSWLAHWSAFDVLAIDEVAERIARPELEGPPIVALVDARYASLRGTVLSGNFRHENAADLLGTSIVSRACERGGIIEFAGWPSFRRPPERQLFGDQADARS